MGGAPEAVKAEPERETLEIVTVELPLLVRVEEREAVLLTLTLPKEREAGLAPRRRVGATPVPLRGMERRELEALLTREREPEAAAAEAGAKRILKVRLWLAAMAAGRVRPEMLKPEPERLACEMVMLEEPVLVSLMVWELLVPVVTFPKLALDGTALSVGDVCESTVRVAALLVTLPAELLTTTVNSAPLSAEVVAAVV